jgi:hypothetical protein
MPPGTLSSANRLRQADATAAGLYRLSNRAFAGSWAMSASSQQQRWRRGDAGGVAASRSWRREKAVDRWGEASIAVRHGLIGIDGGRPHRHATAVGAENDLTSGLSGPVATTLRAPAASPGNDNLGLYYLLHYLLASRARLCSSKADEEFSVARPCRGRREAMVHRTPLR